MSGPHGAIVVDKPQGITSHDVVAGARRALGTRAVGHAGTLDPMATGVLVLLVGEARKLSGYVTQDAKRYRAKVAFGTSTDSDDADGSIRERLELSPGWLDASHLREAVELERARSQQIPPAFSAIHVQGERAHRLSRKGSPPLLAPRLVSVLELDTLCFGDASATFELSVSKGYYVRAFARDLGAALGVPAHLAELRRLSSGGFSLADANPWPLADTARVLPLAETAARSLPVLRLTPEGVRRARLGQALGAEHVSSELSPPAEAEIYALSSPEGDLVALGRRGPNGELRIARGIVPT